MEARLHYIDAGGRLFHGYGREWPIIVWEPEQSRWDNCDLPTRRDWDWGELVTPREAERCYPGCTTALLPEGVELVIDVGTQEMIRYPPEIFDDYDFDCTPRKSPEETAESLASMERNARGDKGNVCKAKSRVGGSEGAEGGRARPEAVLMARPKLYACREGRVSFLSNAVHCATKWTGTYGSAGVYVRNLKSPALGHGVPV